MCLVTLISWRAHQYRSRRSKKGAFSGLAKGPIDPDRTKAAALMKKRGIKDVESAAQLLRGVLSRDPDNVEVKLELADALNTICRMKTNANSLVIEGTQARCPSTRRDRANLVAVLLRSVVAPCRRTAPPSRRFGARWARKPSHWRPTRARRCRTAPRRLPSCVSVGDRTESRRRCRRRGLIRDGSRHGSTRTRFSTRRRRRAS